MSFIGPNYPLTRPQLLVICGSCMGIGGFVGYAYGSDVLRDECNPTPMDVAPIDWPASNYDPANTRTTISESAPHGELTE